MRRKSVSVGGCGTKARLTLTESLPPASLGRLLRLAVVSPSKFWHSGHEKRQFTSGGGDGGGSADVGGRGRAGTIVRAAVPYRLPPSIPPIPFHCRF